MAAGDWFEVGLGLYESMFPNKSKIKIFMMIKKKAEHGTDKTMSRI